MSLNTAGRRVLAAATFAIFAAGLTGTAHAALAVPPSYSIEWLGYLPGGSSGGGNDINDVGQVTGYNRIGNEYTSFIWDTTNGMVDIADPSSGFVGSFGNSINNSGQIAGDGYVTGYHSYVWNAVDGMVVLDELPGGLYGYGQSINNLGQVVGRTNNADNKYHAVLWDGGAITDLGTLAGPSSQSNAQAINDAGQIAGSSYNGSGYVAFRRDTLGVMHDLGDLAGGSLSSTGYDINASGQVAGTGADADGQQAVIWDAAGAITKIGDLAGGSVQAVAFGINDSGRVVGRGSAAAGSHAFVWDALWGIHDLNDLIPPGLGEVLIQAKAINAGGQITGIGTNSDGDTMAFVLTEVSTAVPVPAALVLMLGGLGALGVAARRKAEAQG